jgi:hypothetical protein
MSESRAWAGVPIATSRLLTYGWMTGQGQFLRVSLKQAIEIHAKVLKYRFGRLAPEMAREKALSCSASNDHEGHRVWLEVAEVAESLLRTVERERWS